MREMLPKTELCTRCATSHTKTHTHTYIQHTGTAVCRVDSVSVSAAATTGTGKRERVSGTGVGSRGSAFEIGAVDTSPHTGQELIWQKPASERASEFLKSEI